MNPRLAIIIAVSLGIYVFATGLIPWSGLIVTGILFAYNAGWSRAESLIEAAQ